MKWVGIILAGDGNIDASVVFETREEAEREMDKLLRKYFDVNSDTVYIEAPQTLEETIKEQEDAILEDQGYIQPELP